MNPLACCSFSVEPEVRGVNFCAASGTTSSARQAGESGALLTDAMRRPLGSVTKSQAFSEADDHSSLAESLIVAGSPVPKTRRTSDIRLNKRLADASRSARDCHNERYAWKLACTS